MWFTVKGDFHALTLFSEHILPSSIWFTIACNTKYSDYISAIMLYLKDGGVLTGKHSH